MYWLVVALLSLVISMLFNFLLSRKRTLSKMWFISMYFYLFFFGSILTGWIIYSQRIVTYYEHIVFDTDTIQDICRVSIPVICGLLLLYVFLKRCFGNRNEIVNIKGMKILPFISVKYGMIIVGSTFLLACVINKVMPQYGLWKIENDNIQLEKKEHHIADVTQNLSGYPLWQIDEYPLDLKDYEDKKKIMVLGDSFIWGDGCSNSNYLWWRQLQRGLDEDGYNDCKIIGVGSCGASTQTELYYLMDTNMIEDIKPDMIILGYVSNDAQWQDEERNFVPKQLSPIDYFNNEIGGYCRFMFPNIMYMINDRLNEKKYNTMVYTDETGYPYQQWELETIRDEYLKRYKNEAIKPLGELADSLGIPFILVATPSIPSEEYYEERYGKVLPLFEEAGIPVYNPLELYVKAYKEDIHYSDGINIVNSHPGTATNALLADYVKNILETEYPDYLGKRATDAKTSNEKIVVNDWFPHTLMPVQDEESVTFTYPVLIEPERYLYMPVKLPYIKLCFEKPVDIGCMKVEGLNFNGSETGKIWITYEDKTAGYDSQDLAYVGTFQSDETKVVIAHENVTSVCIHLNTDELSDKVMKLYFNYSEE